MLNYEQGHRAAQVMEQRGGGFASALAQAYFRADNTNARILREAFADLFQSSYEQWTEDKFFPNFMKETS